MYCHAVDVRLNHPVFPFITSVGRALVCRSVPEVDLEQETLEG